MTKIERERIVKAHQAASLLLADLREIQAKTDSVALEELMLEAIEHVAKLSRKLGRIAEQKE
jgi:hypothetical protein